MNRLLTNLSIITILCTCSLFAQGKTGQEYGTKLRTSLNAYSFNAPLMSGEMDINGLLEFSAKLGFDAVDITSYYFPGYPEVPSDRFLYDTKLKAFSLGLEISGIGVRNDFSHPSDSIREVGIQTTKNWIVAAEKLGAPVIRIFAGSLPQEGDTREAAFERLVAAIEECVAFGEAHGVVVAVQNHWDFILTDEHVIQLMERIPSPWFGLILDTGSYRIGDPYKQIENTIPYAVNWQIKEKLFVDGVEVDVDLPRMVQIIKDSNYRGYIPIETLGAGDPYEKVTVFYNQLQAILDGDK